MHPPNAAPMLNTKPSNPGNTLAWITVVLVVLILSWCGLNSGNELEFNAPLIAIVCLSGLTFLLPIAILIIASTKKKPHEVLREAQQEQLFQEQALIIKAAQAAPQAPETAGEQAVLGAAIYGNLAWCNGPWLLLPEQQLAQHGVLIGASGSGKTVTLLRIAYLAAKLYGYKVFFVDAKPSRTTAARFIALMETLGIHTAMFPRQQYNGWNGDGNTLLNRLMAVEAFSEPYYKAACKRVLNAICKPQAPTSSTDFLRKLDTLDLATIPGITAKDLGGVQNRYHAFFDTIEGQLDGAWSFDTVDAGYLLLDGTALKEEAASLGRYIVEDFAHYVTTRKPAQQKTLLIIDEYSALSQSGADTANLFERIRESGGAILVAGQGYASMGDDIERMLDAANFYIVHRSAAPEKLTERAGTMKEVTEMYQFGGGGQEGVNDKGNVKLEEQPAVHPNKARRLATGQCIIITHGRYALAHVATAPEPDSATINQVRAWIDQPAPAIQAPQPGTQPQAPHQPERL